MDTLDALVDGLFDYAGMFPPAALSLEDCIATSAQFPNTLQRPGMVANDLVLTPENWRTLDDEMLADFDRAVRICLVGVDLADAADVAREAIQWNEKGQGATPPRQVTALEVHTDAKMHQPEDRAQTEAALTELRYLCQAPAIALYFEPRASWHHFQDVLAVLDALHAETELPPVGLKVRCAGPTALGPTQLVPIVEAVAGRRIPLKATQGLHHPVAGDSRAGFLGLALALRFAALGRDMDLRDLMREEDLDAFDFSNGVSWRGAAMDLGELGEAMARTPFSIGSCSLHEPDEDLAPLA